MIAATPSSPVSSSANRRPSGARPSSAPLLEWETARSILLIETERKILLDRIAALKKRSYARIVAEDRLKALTSEALRIESAPPINPDSRNPG